MKQKYTMPDGEIVEKDMPTFKTPYNHDTNFESDRTATYCADPSLTKQEFVEETNINTILERFMKTGEPPPMALPEHFADVTSRLTYRDAAERQAEASAMFYQLPANKRSDFLNDPMRWADAVVRATELGDGDTLEYLGIDLSQEKTSAASARVQRADKADPPSGGTPASKTGPTPSESTKQGDTPNPKSDNEK